MLPISLPRRGLMAATCFALVCVGGVAPGVRGQTPDLAAPAAEAPEPRAEPAPQAPRSTKLVWKPEWRRFDTLDYAITGGLVAGNLAISWFWPKVDEPSWSGPILFDDPVRDLFVGETERNRRLANRVSDFGWHIGQFYPIVVDAIVVTWLIRGEPDVAWQLGMIDLETLAAVGLLSQLAHRLSARERPMAQACREDPDYDNLCGTDAMYNSFYSGHTAMAMAGAGLICAHHSELPLYGGGWGDALACGGALALGTTTGLLRMVADRHWASDQLLSMALGLGLGWGIPKLFYYTDAEPDDPTAGPPTIIMPAVRGDTLGIRVLW